MLRITLPEIDGWDESLEEFLTIPEVTLRLEHSLVALSKWEAKYCKPFLDNVDRTPEEMLYYIQCMSLDPVEPLTLRRLTHDDQKKINDYIMHKHTATTIQSHGRSVKKHGGFEFITSELIYGWMVQAQIPFECETWHINRLITLIRTVQILNDPKPKKRPMQDVIAERNALNERRRREAEQRRKANG